MRRPENPKELRYRDFVEKGYVIAGSPATVRQRLEEEVVKGLRVGNLMVLLQIGSMPHELTLQNMDLFAREVLPSLRGFWEEEGWINHWWPEKLRKRASALSGEAVLNPSKEEALVPSPPLGERAAVRAERPSREARAE